MHSCRQCGSQKIIPKVSLRDHYGDNGLWSTAATVEVQGAPNAWIFKDTAAGQVTLSVCGECGYAELHVGNARELWEKYQQAQQR
jgi:hypothetical protein